LKLALSSFEEPFTLSVGAHALIVSFPAPAPVLSWALLNVGFCWSEHVGRTGEAS
jgi:hypothetical protein